MADSTAPINLVPTTLSGGDPAISPITHERNGIISGRPGDPPLMHWILFEGDSTDPDPGDYMTEVNIQIYADSATDAVPGALIAGVRQAYTTKPTHFSVKVSMTGLTSGTIYRWRVNTRDKSLRWGTYTSVLDGRFRPNSVPEVPSNRAIAGSTDPTFYGTLVDRDAGATITEARVVVYQDTPLGAVLMWDSGWDASGGTRFALNYGGAPLVVGERYRWACQVRDQWGSESPLSPFLTWEVPNTLGPDAMSPIDVETRQGSLTPTLTIGHSAAFDAYELEVGRFADGSGLLWDVPPTTHTSTSSKAVVYAGTALTYGRTFYWRAKIRVGGTTWTDWSPWFPFYIDAVPDAPVGSVDGAVYSGVGAFGPYWTVEDTTPTLRFPFSDPDVDKGYADEATRQEIEITDSAGTPFGASPFIDATTPAETFTTGALTLETLYRARARYDDDAGVRSQFGPWLYFKASTAPVVAAGVAVDATDPNPLIDWTFTSAPAKAQRGYQVLVIEDATDLVIYDSGFVESAATEHEVPGEILQHATAYRWSVTAFDTDLLSDTLESAPWTTAFATPGVITGLVATASASTSSVLLEWDAPTLADPDHFWRFYVYRLDIATGLYVRIGEVDDIATLEYTDTEAPHGLSTYRVTVSNGWAEGAPDEATATLSLFWWIADPAGSFVAFELRHVNSSRASEINQQESHEALGRDVPVVVSGELMAPQGSLGIEVMYDETSIIEKLRVAARVDPYVVLKTPYGEVLRVRLGSIERDLGGISTQVGIEYRVVA